MEKKPCPFCGSKLGLNLELDGGIGYETGYRIVCYKCSAKGPHVKIRLDTGFNPDVEATELWNKRS
jgi:Lar family restriction alleviation protein